MHGTRAFASRHIGFAGAAPIMALLLVVTWRFHARLHSAAFPWLDWGDQHQYFIDAQAWSHGNLDAAIHHYLPGYGLSGALFMHVLPWQPFLIPDAISILACLGAFCLIVRFLVPSTTLWRIAAPLLFGATTLGTPSLRQIWLTPWSSTGSAPFAFAALLAALHCGRRPLPWRMGVLGVALGLCAGFRPADASVLLLTCSSYAFLQRRAGTLPLWRLAAGLGLGLLAGTAPWLAAHIAAHGVSLGAYVGRMSELGFEWRLLPLRWVLIGIDARPMLAEGPGIIGAYPWIALGFAGLLFGAVVPGPYRPAWRLIALSVTLHWMLYLCYRDLHPEGLWHFWNIHYFKWSFPFLAVAAVRLLAAFADAVERRQAGLCTGAILLLLLWRPWLDVQAAQALSGGSDPLIETDLSHLESAVFLPVTGSWQAIYFSTSALVGKGATFHSQFDFKLLPYLDGALLVPLRVLSAPPLRLQLDPRLGLQQGKSGHDATQRIRFGLPCFVFPRRSGCKQAKGVVF